jgi:hypothetical protein
MSSNQLDGINLATIAFGHYTKLFINLKLNDEKINHRNADFSRLDINTE